MPRVNDQMGREVNIPENPQKIISLVPSQTELLYDLGLGDRVVGITKFCIHPSHWRKEKQIVGGTKQYRFESIAAFAPDLIIGNKEENDKVGIEKLAKDFPVWMSDIATLADAIAMIQEVGNIVGEQSKANLLSHEILDGFSKLPRGLSEQKALYLIWKKPYMVAGNGTFINEMMKYAGFENVVEEERYPTLELADFKTLNPDVVLLSSEPYPFKTKDIAEIQAVLPNARIDLVDGEMFSWYGSRLKKSPDYFESLK
ncbi:helical backbone metal receptor [Roseivirga misakiensis]|uniref:Cobalamin-binding protein n=1 Tax=Roseivirga misakiensis TaxID=1563681 RepID=A0A1E5SKF9_9BACT|nr:helical backbone metal receptor [Roseivirga misakiensis]OEJ99609.1 cobalamin-binding protein [Roseivirga misakiensis]